jgi:hypothetical protein
MVRNITVAPDEVWNALIGIRELARSL